jgi:arabinose-5-phosphate isomerase
MELKGFQSKDFAKFHPGGALGKKLYLRVADLIIDNDKPKVLASQSLREVIVTMTSSRLGVTAVVNEKDDLLGIITDGDLRRMLEKTSSIDKIAAKDIMTANPKTISADELAVVALDLLRKNEITQLAITDGSRYVGILHIHDLIREGLI